MRAKTFRRPRWNSTCAETVPKPHLFEALEVAIQQVAGSIPAGGSIIH